MKIVLFGATGMVGQGVLRACLLDDEVARVLVVGRTATGKQHEKLREIVHADLHDLSPIENELSGYDACLFCLGVSAFGMKESEYRRITFDLTLGAARRLVERNQNMTFLYVSGGGTDSTERGRAMWARVKGETENALKRLPFKATYLFRPGFIQPEHGVVSKTKLYRAVYAVTSPLFPVWKALFPRLVTTTENLGRAMVLVAKSGASRQVLENDDINLLGEAAAA